MRPISKSTLSEPPNLKPLETNSVNNGNNPISDKASIKPGKVYIPATTPPDSESESVRADLKKVTEMATDLLNLYEQRRQEFQNKINSLKSRETLIEYIDNTYTTPIDKIDAAQHEIIRLEQLKSSTDPKNEDCIKFEKQAGIINDYIESLRDIECLNELKHRVDIKIQSYRYKFTVSKSEQTNNRFNRAWESIMGQMRSRESLREGYENRYNVPGPKHYESAILTITKYQAGKIPKDELEEIFNNTDD